MQKFFIERKQLLVWQKLWDFFSFLFFLHVDRMYYAFLNIGLSSDMIDFDVVLHSRERELVSYSLPSALPSSISFLISVRSLRSHCLIVPRRADVSSNRIDSLAPLPSFVISIFFCIEIILDEYSHILIHNKVKTPSDDYNRVSYLSFVLKTATG